MQAFFQKYYFLLIAFVPLFSYSQDIIVIKDENVGIKNDHPKEKLDVYGNINISDTLVLQNELNVSSANAIQYQQNGFDLLPKGAIIIWTKSTIPDGWTICDGRPGTPNLKGRFVVGVGKRDKNLSDHDEYYNEAPSYSLDSKGGTEKIKLEKIPPHKHSYKNNESPSKQENISAKEKDANGALAKISTAFDQTQDVYGGTGQPHSNLPPYYALYYIMKL
jgi:hypothetical protein